MPLISVIIPTYNRLELLQRAVDSVLAQEFKDLELIIIDDGSMDGTYKRFRDSEPPVFYYKQPNQGVSAARNSGISLARGEFIAFLDSDDCWEPRKLSVQSEFFENNPNILICQTDEIWIRNGKKVNPMKKHEKPTGYIFNESLKLCAVSPSSVMMRKEFFDKVGLFDEKMHVCEDYDLWLRTAYRMNVPLIPDPLVVKYGGHADQLSKKYRAIDRFRIYSLQKLLGEPLNDEQRLLTLAEIKIKCGILMKGALKRGRIIFYAKVLLTKHFPDRDWGIIDR
ncbi:glycosyltransferase family 2 protein [candidate division KSB1 bacterium]